MNSRKDKSLFLAPKKTYFLKIMNEDTIRDERLLIPRSFMRKHGNELSSPVVLKDRNGTLWKIELDKSDGDVWLHDGWQEFADRYSVKIEHMILFGYEGNSKFSVFIYDLSATEIDYPVVRPGNQDSNFQEHLTVKVATFDTNSPRKKKMRSNGTGNAVRASKSETLRSRRKVNQCSSIQEIKDCDGKKNSFGGNALKRAELFKSKNPFFILTMHPTYIHFSRRLNLPAYFSKQYLNRSEGGHAILYNSSMKSWWVKWIQQENPRRAKFAKGWADFARDNHLEKDDACVFELVGDSIFKVSIFRASEDGNCSGENEEFNQEKMIGEGQPDEHPPCSSRIVSAAESAGKFVSKHPFFQVVLRSTYLKQYLHVPFTFVQRHMKNKVETVTLQVGERTWSATFCNSSNRLRGGWPKFVKDESMREGDACVFELIDSEKFLMKVSIFRAEI